MLRGHNLRRAVLRRVQTSHRWEVGYRSDRVGLLVPVDLPEPAGHRDLVDRVVAPRR